MGACSSVDEMEKKTPWLSAVSSWRYARYQPPSESRDLFHITRSLLNCDLLRTITAYQPGICKMIRYMICRWKRQTGPYAKAHYIVYSMPPHHKSDRLYILKELYRGCPRVFSRTLMDLFAKAGYLECLQFMHQHYRYGCTPNAMDLASGNGHLEIVHFLHFNRTEGCTTNAMDLAAASGHLKLLQFLHLHRTEGCTNQAICSAVVNGHLNIVQYLLHHCHSMLQTQGKHVSNEYCHEWLSLQHLNTAKLTMLRQQCHSATTITTENQPLNPLDVALFCGQIEIAHYLHDHWDMKRSVLEL